MQQHPVRTRRKRRNPCRPRTTDSTRKEIYLSRRRNLSLLRTARTVVVNEHAALRFRCQVFRHAKQLKLEPLFIDNVGPLCVCTTEHLRVVLVTHLKLKNLKHLIWRGFRELKVSAKLYIRVVSQQQIHRFRLTANSRNQQSRGSLNNFFVKKRWATQEDVMHPTRSALVRVSCDRSAWL